MSVKSLDELNLAQKRVLVRVDYNVPMDAEGRIADDSRIQASLATLRHLFDRQCSVTLMSHLGRPKGAYDSAYSMKPVARHLSKLLGQAVHLVDDFEDGAQHHDIQILENLRFHPGETKNDEGFAKALAAYGDVYVNDAFGAAHRAHASIDAVTHHFEQKGAGYLLMKEIHYLRESLREPERSFLAILGGSKISDKLKVIKGLLKRVDQLMIGGGMSYTFLKAQGCEIGNSLVEEEFIGEAKQILRHCKDHNIELILPLDHVTGAEFKEDTQAQITLDRDIQPATMGLDIGPETIQLYCSKVAQAKTVVWNGPMGVFEWEPFSTGTVSVAEAVAEHSGLTIVGGGDSVAAINGAGLEDKIKHISTGGGASLELLAGNVLPGIAALEAT